MTEPDRQEPHDKEAEEYVLGAMMLSAHAIDVVREILQPGDFYLESHRHVCRVVFDLHDIGTAVDAITVIDELRQRDRLADVGGADGAEGGKQRVREIATVVPAASNAAHHAGIVARDARRRRQAAVGRHLTQQAYDSTDPDRIQSEAQAMLDELAGRGSTARPKIVSATSFLADTEEPAVAAIGEPGETLLPLGGLLIMGGEGGASKTTLTLDAVAHMASGTPWLEYAIGRPLQILIIENEGPRPQFREKLQAKATSWTGADWIPNVHVWEEPWASFSFAHDTDRRHLQDTAAELKIDIVVADPLDSLGIEGGGTPEDVRKFIAMLKKCGLHNPITPLGFWILHHFNKGVGGSIVQRLSGAWGGHPDAIIGVELGDDQTTKLTWGKLRHATPPKDKTLMLSWDIETRGFAPIAKAQLADANATRQAVIDYVTETPGLGRTAVEDAIHPTIEASRKQIRDAIQYLLTAESGPTLIVLAGPKNAKCLYPASALSSPLAAPLFGELANRNQEPEASEDKDISSPVRQAPSRRTGEQHNSTSDPLAEDQFVTAPSLPKGEGPDGELDERQPDPVRRPQPEHTSNDSPPANDRLAEQREWIDSRGYTLPDDDLDRELLHRGTSRYDLQTLRDYATARRDEALGVTRT